MQVHAPTDTNPKPFAVDIYRTDDVLFIHRQKQSLKKHLASLRYVAIFLAPFCLFFVVVALLNGKIDGAIGTLVGCTVLFGLFALIGYLDYLIKGGAILIRIDRDKIASFAWGASMSIDRPASITFFEDDSCWRFEREDKKRIPLPPGLHVSTYEMHWIKETIKQFEAEIPRRRADEETRPNADVAETVSAKTIQEHME